MTIKIGVDEHGRHYAASDASPYFCFEADTEKAVIAKAHAAFAFYAQSKAAPTLIVSRTVELSRTQIFPQRTVQWADMALAVA